MSEIEARLAELGYALPEPAAPLASYVPAVRSGRLVFTSGQLPVVRGELLAKGLVADDPTDGIVDGWMVDSGIIDVPTAQRCAAVAAMNALAAVRSVIDSLDQVTRIVKLTGFVAGVEGFSSHPKVLNGASDLIGEVWGDRGKHARSAVGVASLPLGAPIEIELIAEIAG